VDTARQDYVVRLRFEHLEVDPVDLRKSDEYPVDGIFRVGHQLVCEELHLLLDWLIRVPRMNISRSPPNLQAIANPKERQTVAAGFASQVKREGMPQIGPMPGPIEPPEKDLERAPHN
jgi:hypothetical protein